MEGGIVKGGKLRRERCANSGNIEKGKNIS